MKVMNIIKSIIKFFAVPFFTFFAWLSRKWASHTHQMLYYSEWFYNAPENFDHQIDIIHGKNKEILIG